jgi:hypothetical protein
MLERPPTIDARLREIEDAIGEILARLDALEGRALSERAPYAGRPPAAEAALPSSARGVLGFAGRTFIVLGGAFLLRALTEEGVLPSAVGAWLGLVYAVLWLGAADRSRGTSALFHGLAALVVALPLILESAARLRFSPIESAIALGAIGLLSLGVAWHRGIQVLAAIALAGVLLTAAAVGVSTSHFVSFAALVMLIGITSLWMGYACRWSWAAWPPAIAANLAVAASVARALADPPRDAPASALTLLALLVVSYLGSFALRNLFHERSIRLFEMAQTAAVLLVGIGGAVIVARQYGYGVAFIAVPSLVAGAVTYVQALSRVLPRRGRGTAFTYYLTLAFVLVLVGASLLVPGGWRPMIMAAAAVAASVGGWRLGLPVLVLHGAVAGIVAAIQSGLPGFAASAWARSPQSLPAPTFAVLLVLAALCICYAMPRPPERREEDAAVLSAARLPLAAVIVWTMGALLVVLGGPLLAGTRPNPGMLATWKTVILAAAAVGLAAIRGRPRVIELGWLVYPVLGLGLVKIFVEDFAVSDPAMLFVALVAYGAALTLASRLARN